ncbi:MAG: ribulose-phosphate 3-epimerase [Firmicutes bacterium]|nr:ribulose-phosphate 3-epimerase [Bacillota bacterium]
MKVAVSYLKSDNKKKCIEKIDASIADFIHVDLCDGKYVEAKNFTIGEITKLLKNAHKPLDVHLMVKEPLKYIDDLALLNINTVTIHLDGCKEPKETIDYIKSIGLKVGIAVNPDEEIDILKSYLPLIDEVLIMSVVPGKGGQKFMPEVLQKFAELNILKNDFHFFTAVDGGINEETINYLKDLQVDMVVSGSYITDSEDYNENIKKLKAV